MRTQPMLLRNMRILFSKIIYLTNLWSPAKLPLPNQKFSICSFYCVTPSSICRETLPANLAKRLPHYPIPVFLLAHLAVHKKFHGSGLGRVSLIKALAYLLEVDRFMPAYIIVVDCLNDAAQNFYAKYGFEILCEQNGRIRMFLPMKTVKLLFNKK